MLTLLGIMMAVVLSAQHFDANWPVGTNEYSNTASYGNAMIRFQDDSISVEKANLRMNFESTVGAISDSLGNLLFFTNGCYVATASGDTMQNGEGLNPGEVHNWVCPENGYISHRGAMVLPMPGSDHIFCLFHMGVRYDSAKKLQFGPFYLSVVDMALNNGLGVVTSKNKVLVDGNLEPFAAIRHGNGRDWWILVPENNSNRYRRFIVTPEGVFENPMLEIGSLADCLRVGSSTFSLDGRKFARQQNCKTLIFDFDRCNGTLSNPLELLTPAYTFGGGGVAFSPDGNQLYTTAQMAILSANLELPNPIFDTLITTEAITGAGLHFMQYTPDGNRILLNILHRSRFFSALDSLHTSSPFFMQKAVPLPVYSVRTLPNFPNFRLYDLPNSPCDTLGINSPVFATEPLSAVRAGLLLSPNPARDQVRLEIDPAWTSNRPVNYQLINALGSLLRKGEIPKGTNSQQVSLAGLPKGVYFFQLMQGREMLGTARLVVL